MDEALFYAIASEYELPRDEEALKTVLDTLKASALEQDATDFDPSGTGGLVQLKDNTDTSRSGPDDTFSNGITSTTTGISEHLWTDSEGLGQEVENASAEFKTAWLHNLFPDVPLRELGIILESHDGSVDKATDELLNLSFLNQGNDESFGEEVPVAKGIEAFAEGSAGLRKGRKKRRKNRTNESSRASSASSFAPELEENNRNVWSTMSEDVDFICSRTGLHPQTVRSAYHANGARLGRTIRALATNKIPARNQSTDADPIMELQIAEFTSGFENVPTEQLMGLLLLARNMPSAARELLEAMTGSNEPHDKANITLVTQYAPIRIDGDDGMTSESSMSGTWTPIRSPYIKDLAATHRAAASHNFGQASSAFKKSKSDRLMGGAAAYYSQLGHDRMRVAKELHAAEADTLVAQQSSSTVLDLHGVSVADAVRIANNRTHNWWDGLGDTKYAPGGGGPARAGFKIVTGVGTHSKNHAPRIGPAVSKMLIKEGWKVEIGHGELLVTGKVRRG